MDVDKKLQDIQNFLENIYLEVEELKAKQSELDKKEQDILHKIEFCSFSACEGYKLCSLLKEVRNEKRNVKNNLDKLNLLTPLTDKSFKNKVTKTISIIDKHNKKILKRTYRPRVYDELFSNPKAFYKTIGKKDGEKNE